MLLWNICFFWGLKLQTFFVFAVTHSHCTYHTKNKSSIHTTYDKSLGKMNTGYQLKSVYIY